MKKSKASEKRLNKNLISGKKKQMKERRQKKNRINHKAHIKASKIKAVTNQTIKEYWAQNEQREK